MSKSTELLKKKVKEWSGFELHGKTKDELISSIEQISYDLESEIDMKKKAFIDEVAKLNIPEH